MSTISDSMGPRLQQAGIAGAVGFGVTAAPIAWAAATFGTQRYGESYLHMVGRKSAIPIASVALPVAAAAAGAQLAGGEGGAAIAGAAAAGAVTGATLMGTVLYKSVSAGAMPPASRLATAGLGLAYGATLGFLTGAVSVSGSDASAA